MQTYWDVWTDCNTCRRWWNKTWMHSCAHSHKYMACLFVGTHMQLQIMYNGMIMAEQVFLHYSHWIVLTLHLYCILLYCVSVSPVVGACVCTYIQHIHRVSLLINDELHTRNAMFICNATIRLIVLAKSFLNAIKNNFCI